MSRIVPIIAMLIYFNPIRWDFTVFNILLRQIFRKKYVDFYFDLFSGMIINFKISCLYTSNKQTASDKQHSPASMEYSCNFHICYA